MAAFTQPAGRLSLSQGTTEQTDISRPKELEETVFMSSLGKQGYETSVIRYSLVIGYPSFIATFHHLQVFASQYVARFDPQCLSKMGDGRLRVAKLCQGDPEIIVSLRIMGLNPQRFSEMVDSLRQLSLRY